MSPRQFSVVAVVLLCIAAMHAVIHGVGIGETMHGIAAVAERHECRRRDKAKGSENGDHHRRAEAKPGAQLLQHWGSLLPQAERCKPYESGVPGLSG